MKTLYFECQMGAAGDMLMSALLELHPDADGFIERLNKIGIPNVKIKKECVSKCGICGTGIKVLVHGQEEDEHHHVHCREHGHAHHHIGMSEVCDIIENLKIPDKVKTDVISVYKLIAEAEGYVHGREINQIHFHEVGSMDAIADITGVCMLINELNPDKIYTSHIHVGCGQVKCAHGILPVPAPATAYILRGVPSYGGRVYGELCTPTGAALLKYFTDEFVGDISMNVDKIGYGMGKRHFYSEDNIEILSAVRAMTGEKKSSGDNIIMLSCNVDDMTGEQMGFASEQLINSGALDVYTTPVYMKKNRPGILITVMCREEDKEKMAGKIFKYTTTIGIRELSVSRYVLERNEETVHTAYGDVRVKKTKGFGVSKAKAEYEDIKRIALQNDISISDIKLDL